MVCDCCKRKKRIFESYAFIKTNDKPLHLCVNCNDLLYKLRDASDGKNIQDFSDLIAQLNAKEEKSSSAFNVWKNEFVLKCEKHFTEQSASAAMESSN